MGKTMLLLLVLLVTVASASASASADEKIVLSKAGNRGSGCWYTVSIKTSCSSRKTTRDAISLAFGDAYHNEIYAARLDDPSPSSRIFERCSTDTFKIQGPCAYQICYLYLRRSGRDGWKPQTVKVVSSYYSPVNFDFQGRSLPNNVWYGFNLCSSKSQSQSSSSS